MIKYISAVLIFLFIYQLSKFTFYTNEKLDILIEHTYNRITNYGYLKGEEIRVINLEQILRANIYAQRPDTINKGDWGAGQFTSDAYSLGWKWEVMQNPKLIDKSLDLFLNKFIRKLNKRLSKSQTKRQFLKTFWSKQYRLLIQYQSLTDSLLTLDNNTLHKYIYSEGDSKKFQEWLLKKELITPSNLIWTGRKTEFVTISQYPLDLLLLIDRSTNSTNIIGGKKWNERDFLKALKKPLAQITKRVKKEI